MTKNSEFASRMLGRSGWSDGTPEGDRGAMEAAFRSDPPKAHLKSVKRYEVSLDEMPKVAPAKTHAVEQDKASSGSKLLAWFVILVLLALIGGGGG